MKAQIKKEYWEKYIKGTSDALAWTHDWCYEIVKISDDQITLKTIVTSATINLIGEREDGDSVTRRRTFNKDDLIMGD